MTEDEAKTKWCPFARVAGPVQSKAEGVSYNRWPPSDGTMKTMLRETPTARCIGSRCMAWRWHLKGTDPDLIAARQYPDVPEPNEPDGGYCGMAGKP